MTIATADTRRTRRHRATPLCAMWLTLCLCAPASAQNLLVLEAGAFDVLRASRHPDFQAGAALRLPLPLLQSRLGAQLGFLATDDGARFTFVGAVYDWSFTPRWTLSPSFGGGRFRNGRSKDLGNGLQFRSGLELTWRSPAGVGIGLEVYHLSHGGVQNGRNPGEESLVLKLLLPLPASDGWKPGGRPLSPSVEAPAHAG